MSQPDKSDIRVRTFKILTVQGRAFEHADAIYYPDDTSYQMAKLDGSHEAEKLIRANNVKNSIENPPTPVEPTKSELQAQKSELQKQIAEIDVAIGKAK